MAGLTAAWALSRPELRDRVAEVTVYQRGWRLGGKGASSRGAHGRIEEHGLHVWLGYYDNAFRLLRDVYGELDRPATDPGCPIRTWRDAFVPAEMIGVAERGPAGWAPWVASFGRNGLEPGDPAVGDRPLGAARFARQAVSLLADVWAAVGPPEPAPGGVFLSGSSRPPAGGGLGGAGGVGGVGSVGGVVRRAEAAAVAAALQAVSVLDQASRAAGPLATPVRTLVLDRLGELAAQLRARVLDHDSGRRLSQLTDLLVTCVRGMVVDGLVAGTQRYPDLDDEDFRAWLARHGADADTLRSPLVTAMYDFTFAYEGGDPERPAFAAGLGLFLASKLFFEYKGSLFWKMRAGMGDVVFAPLYQALRARGVRFELFCRLDALRLDAAGRSVAAVELGRQARPRSAGGYDPLVRVRGLPCFPSEPDLAQLAGLAGAGPGRVDGLLGAERHGGDLAGEEPVTLRAGEDYDVLVLATSLGMVPLVAGELVAASDRWRRMVEGVATVPTQAAQLWLTRTEAELGWAHPGATLSGWAKPLDTYASMSHLLPMEGWPEGDRPRGLAYLCSALEDRPGAGEETVRAGVARILEERMADLWPRVGRPGGGVPADVLHGGLDAQHVVAATDPSDRYVQSLPGSHRHRLRVDESGLDNLVLAGDWTRCGLDAGCIEAAVLSGLQAANAVAGRPLLDGVLGSWYPMDPVAEGVPT
jgi:uncharacterized protein with NAD-binding domain and iron-sulfur cluster